jgi:hypothetical protein
LGVLIVNASTVMHLNETAAEYAFHFIHNTPADEVVALLSAKYDASLQLIEDDYLRTTNRILSMIETPDLDPVTFFDFNRRLPYSGAISAPYRLDIALTYSLPEGVSPHFAPQRQVERELSKQEWIKVLDLAWQFGIPHIVFTGGEPTLRADLPDLIAHAEYLGQVSGLLTDGQKLVDSVYLHSLLSTGLDHIMILLNPDDPGDWQAIKIASEADIFAAVHLTLTPENSPSASALLERLASLGVPAVSLTASTIDLKDSLSRLRDKAATLGMSLVWDLPVPYSVHNPVAWEMQEVHPIPTGAGRAWLYVEPDGDVFTTQGGRKLGNILADSWQDIYNLK